MSAEKLIGRPSSYTVETGDAICERLAIGESLRSICLDEDMPAMSTVFRWLSLDQAFSEQYARAREEQAEALADEIVSISDESETTTLKEGGIAYDSTAVARNRLRVDARKWVASKLKPKKYGDRIQQDVTGTLTVTHEQWLADLK
jgi:hypothetical protein